MFCIERRRKRGGREESCYLPNVSSKVISYSPVLEPNQAMLQTLNHQNSEVFIDISIYICLGTDTW